LTWIIQLHSSLISSQGLNADRKYSNDWKGG
jgi:hypothetical protein